MLLLAGCAGLPGTSTQSGDGVAVAGESGNQGANSQQQAGQSGACDYASLYDRTIDSVVSISANGGLGSGFVYRVGGADDAGTATPRGTATPASAGTSYVVTNAHVVGETDSVQVQFAREETRSGTVVGQDRYSDLAVIRVDGTPGYVDALPVAESAPEPGRQVAAMGNPFGLEETITHGIVSGVNRSMPTRGGFSIPNVVQTDAPISPGNSGGPLVTCDGTVVGVNSAGIAAQGAENIGFAISPALVNQVVPTMIETGEYDHAYLGISSAPFTPSLAAANGFEETGGVYVHEVVDGGPASGVLQGSTDVVVQDGQRVPVGGDLIVAIEGQPIASMEDLSSYLVVETRPGDTVTLTIVRDGQRQEVQVTLGERPSATSP